MSVPAAPVTPAGEPVITTGKSGPPGWARTLLTVLGYATGFLLLLVVTFLLLGVPPITGLNALWTGAFGDAESGHLYSLSETLIKMSPLLLTGLGLVVAWQAGLFSIGGEGQLLMGALTATAFARYGGGLPGPVLTVLMLAGGTLAGAFWSLIAGWLRVRRNVQEVISTIMLNYIALYLMDWALHGPLQERLARDPKSDPIPAGALFPHLIPAAWSGGMVTRLHSGVLLALIAVPVIYALLYHTAAGFGMRTLGQNPDAARTARFPVDRLRLQAMAVSGGLCGLAGVIELLGITERLYADFSPGWGFTAIPVALLGGLHPIGTLGSAFFFGSLTAGSGNLARFAGVSARLINILQAVAVLAVVGLRAWREGRE